MSESCKKADADILAKAKGLNEKDAQLVMICTILIGFWASLIVMVKTKDNDNVKDYLMLVLFGYMAYFACGAGWFWAVHWGCRVASQSKGK